MNPEQVQEIVERNNGSTNGLIGALEEIQVKCGYLPEDALRAVAEATNRPLVDIYGVATFYRAFSLKPRGEHLLSCCIGTACHVRGAPRVAEEVEKQLRVAPGETTSDNQFTFETVNCLGACALGPVVVVDAHYFSQVNTSRVAGIVEKTREGLDTAKAETDSRCFPVNVSCSHCSHSLMDPTHPLEGHPSVKLGVALGDGHGWLRLSSLYGSRAYASDCDLPMDEVARLSCPDCRTELIGAGDCPECGAKMAPFLVQGGGTLQVCPRRGCKGHILDLD